MDTFKNVGLALLAIMLISGCGDSVEKQRVGREFSAMEECLNFIRSDTGERLKVITDKPGDVSGSTEPNKLFFRCELKATGTRGLVLEGRWDRIKK